MGIGMWIAAGVVAWALGRLVRAGRTHWAIELVIGTVAALILGLVATALDFGGWAELDWRAGLFVFFGALATFGCLRSVTIFRRGSLKSSRDPKS